MNECLFFTTQFFSNLDKQKLAKLLSFRSCPIVAESDSPKNVAPFTKPLMQSKMYAKIKA